MNNDDDGKRHRNFWEWAALGIRAALIAADWWLNRRGPDLLRPGPAHPLSRGPREMAGTQPGGFLLPGLDPKALAMNMFTA
ncbi:hypothetical protein SAMN05444920_12211 [Nonomuraea solani]|uniref:Uncharacterized protein n=1 Tax=Nonomuraea solani TaxID=1144553 RepID=A0A1H6EVG9_9ACTN|nr:hypothetical protein [Nonomuraea solani]SEH01762.1 hypothetical protein SAMN05444920_12211 [Nonomuraea solani]